MFPWRRLQSTRERRRRSVRTARRARPAHAASRSNAATEPHATGPIDAQPPRPTGSSAPTRPGRGPSTTAAATSPAASCPATARSAAARPTFPRPTFPRQAATCPTALPTAVRPTAAASSRVSPRSAATRAWAAPVQPRASPSSGTDVTASGTAARASGAWPTHPTGPRPGRHRVHSARRSASRRTAPPGRGPAGVVAGSGTRFGTVSYAPVEYTRCTQFDASVLTTHGRAAGSNRVRPAPAAGTVHRGAQATGSTCATSSAPPRTRSTTT